MRVVILGSGTGSNAKAILQAERRGGLGNAKVVQILADQPEAGILVRGQAFDVPAEYLDAGPFKTKLEGEGEDRYIDRINALEPDLIVLAGFMRVLKPRFINAFAGKIINLHPSLLPSFPGLDGIGQAWRRGVKISGCTVHYVTAEVDGGPIIDQAAVRIAPDDTLQTFGQKIHVAEHELLPSVVARLSVAN
ncbi:MAG: phosphoribosylglycinamide formyltransferase [Synoicihabitans sp.]